MKADGFDLLSFVKALTRNKGINPLEYHQTFKQANGKRWGNSSIINQNGIGIDLVFQEFQWNYPSMYETIDDFVEGLADRLSRVKDVYDEYSPEQRLDYVENEESIILNLQTKHKLDRLGVKVLEDWIEKDGRKVKLNKKGIKKILEMSLDD